MKQAIGALIAALCLGLTCGCGDDDKGGGSAASCRDTCEQVVEANCNVGPASVEECESQCDQFAATSACSASYTALQNCGKGKPIVCDPTFMLAVPEGCSDEEQDFISCYVQNS